MPIAAPAATAPLPQAGQVPQPNVSDTGRGINNVPMPVDPSQPYTPPTTSTTSSMQAPPPPPPDPFAAYINSFNSSLANSRQQLDQGLAQALGGLAQRNDAASAVLATLPASVNQNYNLASGMLNSTPLTNAQSGITAAQAKAQGAPMAAALAADKGAAAAASPALRLAQLATDSAGQTALNQQHMAGELDLNQQQAAFMQHIMDMKTQQALDTQRQQAQWAHDAAMLRDPNNPDSIAGKLAIFRAESGQQPAAGPEANTGLTQQQVTDVKNSPQYSRFVQLITNGIGSGKEATKADPGMIIKMLQTSNPALLTVLQQEHPDFFFQKDSKSATGYSTQLNSNLVKGGDTGFLGNVGAALGGTFSWQGPKTAWAGLTQGANPYDPNFYRNNGAR